MPKQAEDTRPIRPSRYATEEDLQKYPGIFELGQPLGWTRDQSKWLPDWTLEARPLPEVPEHPVRDPNSPQPVTKTKKRKTNMSNPDNTPVTYDTTPPTLAQLTSLYESGDWEMIARLGMLQVAAKLEKKPIASLVKWAIDLRGWAKQQRELETENV